MNNKLPLKVKICYGTGSFGKVVQGLAGSTFLMYFYTQVLEINAGIAASIIFFAKVFDIVNDPLIGAMCDKSRSKNGKCRSFLKWGAIPTGIFLALSFITPGEPSLMRIIWAAVTYTILATASSFIQIPMNTLMGRLTDDELQRSHLNQISGLISLFANYFIVSYTLPVVSFFGGGSLSKGFMVLGIIYGLIYAVSYLIVYAGTKGYEPRDNLAIYSGDSPKITDVMQALWRNKVWLCISLYYLFDMIATTMESTAMVYYFQYNFQNTGLLSTYSAIAMIGNFAIFSCLHIIIRKLGNGGTTLVGCIISMCGDLLRFTLHDASMTIMICGWIMSALGACMVAGTVLLNIFDAKLYGEWKTGIKSEALLMSGFTLATKVGMAIGSSAVGWLLTLVPFTEGAETQPEVVLNFFFILNTLLPAIAFGIVFVLAIPVYKIQKKLPEIKKEVENRI